MLAFLAAFQVLIRLPAVMLGLKVRTKERRCSGRRKLPALQGGVFEPDYPSDVFADRGVGSARLLVDSRGPGPSFVAINQTWDQGWRARSRDLCRRLRDGGLGCRDY